MNLETFITNSKPFLRWALNWRESLPTLAMTDVIGKHPERVAVLSVDIVNGFCYEGPLASPRVAALVNPIIELFKNAHAAGVRHFILTQDSHPADAVEFASYPPHCVRGTSESETVAAFTELPFFDEFIVMPKNSLSSSIGTDLDPWLDAHPAVNTFITVGDCTDLCTYQLAMHLKLRANAANRRARVLLPVDCVDTYDLPVETAEKIGAIPHDGNLLHLVFLYNMMLNGVEVVAGIK